MAALPTLLTVAVALFWAWRYGGLPVTRWYPGAVLLLVVLAALVFGARPRLRELSRPVQVALGALALFTAWSFASISWSDDQGAAWEGANRTLLYLVMFTIPALSRLDGPRALLVVGGWTLGIVVLGVAVLLRLPEAIGPGAAVLGPGVGAPTGYSNAQACLLVMAAWPALVLSTRAAVHPALRGLFAGGAVVLFDVALLSQSRGAEITAVILLVVLLVAFAGRVRSLVGLVPVAIGLVLTAPRMREVSGAVQDSPSAISELGTLAGPVLTAAILVGLAVLVLGLLERWRPPKPAFARRAGRVVAVGAIALAVVGAVVVLATVGAPVDRAQNGWDAFKRGGGVAAGGQDAFTNYVGGARYDYYRVALQLIEENPYRGVGADNFAQDYAARGRAIEFPAYVHSTELRTLVHTGIIGAVLLALALGAALVATWRAARVEAGRALSAAVGVAATMVALQWLVQGSADWFWEFPALGGAAFVMLGVACALAPERPSPSVGPRTDEPPQDDPPTDAPVASRRAPRGLRLAGLAAGAVALVIAALSLVLPWTAAIEMQRASRVWPTDPAAAFRQLELAADLNPLSSRPAIVEGTIALRLGQADRATDAFTRALERDPREAYSTLALGALASQRGDREQALTLLRRAATLNRQDAITQGALAQVRDGERVDIDALLEQYEQIARDAVR